MKGFVKVVNYIGNVIILNALFLLTSALTLMLGFTTSLTALHAALLDLRCDENGYYVRNYFKNFRRNLKSTLIVNFIVLAIVGAAYLNFLMINSFTDASLKLILFAVMGVFLLELSIIYVFLVPVIAKFQGTLMQQVHEAFIFAHKYLPLSLLFIILNIGAVLSVIYLSFALVFIIFGLVAGIEDFILKHLWRKYDELFEIQVGLRQISED